MKIKIILITTAVSLLCTACSVKTNTETVVQHNKFKEHTTVLNNNNYVKKVKECESPSFGISYLQKDTKPVQPTLLDDPCYIHITTTAKSSLNISKGKHMWLHLDDEKFDLVANSYSGEKITTYSTSIYYGIAINNKSDKYFETASFVAPLSLIEKIAQANNLSFEIESQSSIPISGHFRDENFLAFKNFVNEVVALKASSGRSKQSKTQGLFHALADLKDKEITL